MLNIKSKNKYGVNLVAAYPREYSYIKPIIDYLQKEKIPISFYLDKSVINSQLLKITKRDNIFEINRFNSKHNFREFVYKILRKINWVLFKSFIKIPRINFMISKSMSLFFDNPLKYKTTLTITKHKYPWLLSSRNNYIITFPGSWDHYFKYYLGYYSDVYFGWSAKMNSHWQNYQGCSLSKLSFPYIFDYVADIDKENIFENKFKKFNTNKKRLKILYPLATCLEFGESIYKSELYLVNIIKKALSDFDVDFLVKAKPNTSKSELDELNSMFKLSEVKEPLKHIDSFSKEYNLQRRELLGNVDSVINFGTTFAIDSAIANLPIMQLDLRNYLNKDIFNLSILQNKFKPLEDYLLSEKDLIYPIYSDDDIYKSVNHYVKDLSILNIESKAFQFSKYLRESFTGTNYLSSKERLTRVNNFLYFIKDIIN